VFPGDCVLLSSEALSVTQALLTGESIPVEKNVRFTVPGSDYRFDLLDNENICLDGTSVVTGSGRALVISTGDKTYMASIAKDLAKKRPLNVMQVGVRKVSYLLLLFMAVSRSLFIFFVENAC
jgi:P-type Mg2+ transporter